MNYQPQYPGYPAQPGQPQAPVQPYAQPQAPAYPQQPYAQPQAPAYPQQYPPQGYGQPQAAQPAPALAQGSLDDFYNQPSVGGGPSISWTNKDGSQKPVGTTCVGVVARDVTASDVQQETDFKTQQPKFYRDGRPKFTMKVPLQVQPSAEFPEGEASFYVKGSTRDELVRAMGEAGVSGSPKAGAAISITLVHRKPMGQGMNPANVVQIQYTPAGQAPAAPQQQFQQAPAPQPVAQGFDPNQLQAPAQQPVPQVQAPVQQYAAPQAPVQQAPQVMAPVAPAPQPAPPSGLTPEQQALLAQIAGQQANPAA